MLINCYGHNSNAGMYSPAQHQPKPYKVEVEGEYTYITFGNYATGIIHRIHRSGNVTTMEWSYGAVANKASLPYVGINDILEV